MIQDTFLRNIGEIPTGLNTDFVLKAAYITTPLGPMLAIANDSGLYLLEFADRPILEREIERLRKKTKSIIVPGTNQHLRSIEQELDRYFSGKLEEFKTPLAHTGTAFQNRVWEELKKIPYGQTRSYYDIAVAVGKPTAFRAVALANSSNQLALIIPCHRVINLNGKLGGYGAGIVRKEQLINHEKNK